MKETQVNTLLKIIYMLSSVMVLLGAFFKLQHYPHGMTFLLLGFLMGAVCSFYDVGRLKKKNKQLEEQLKQKE